LSGSQKLLERLAALKIDAHRVVEHLQALYEGVEDLHTQLAEAEQDRKALRQQRESLETQIMDMIREFDDPSFPDNIRYFPGSHPDDVA
jgi:uncharacterized coiled-coil DUF342 family protein